MPCRFESGLGHNNFIKKVYSRDKLFNDNGFIDDDYDIQISAKEKINVDKLMNKLILKIEDLTSKERLDSAIINQRQLDYFIRLKNLLDEAVENIKNMPYEEIISNQIYEAINILEKIKGKKINEEMLNNIFNRFCIGK